MNSDIGLPLVLKMVEVPINYQIRRRRAIEEVVLDKLKMRDIVNVHYWPIYTNSYYVQKYGPMTWLVLIQVLSFSYPGLHKDVDFISSKRKGGNECLKLILGTANFINPYGRYQKDPNK